MRVSDKINIEAHVAHLSDGKCNKTITIIYYILLDGWVVGWSGIYTRKKCGDGLILLNYWLELVCIHLIVFLGHNVVRVKPNNILK